MSRLLVGTLRLVSKRQLTALLNDKNWDKILLHIDRSELPFAHMSSTYTDGKTLLHFSAENGHMELLKKVLHLNRTLLEQKDDNGHTALHAAFEAEPLNNEVITYLLEQGAKCPVEHEDTRRRVQLAQSSPGPKSPEEEILQDLCFLNSAEDFDDGMKRELLADVDELSDRSFSKLLDLFQDEFKPSLLRHPKLVGIKATFRRNILVGIIELIRPTVAEDLFSPTRQEQVRMLFSKHSRIFRAYADNEMAQLNSENRRLVRRLSQVCKRVALAKKKDGIREKRRGRRRGSVFGQRDRDLPELPNDGSAESVGMALRRKSLSLHRGALKSAFATLAIPNRRDDVNEIQSSEPKNASAAAATRNAITVRASQLRQAKQARMTLAAASQDAVDRVEARLNLLRDGAAVTRREPIQLSEDYVRVSSKVKRFAWLNAPLTAKERREELRTRGTRGGGGPRGSSSAVGLTREGARKKIGSRGSSSSRRERPLMFKAIRDMDGFLANKAEIEAFNCPHLVKILEVRENGLLLEHFPSCVPFKTFVQYYTLNWTQKRSLVSQLIDIVFFLHSKHYLLKKFNLLVSTDKHNLKLVFDGFIKTEATDPLEEGHSSLSSASLRRRRRRQQQAAEDSTDSSSSSSNASPDRRNRRTRAEELEEEIKRNAWIQRMKAESFVCPEFPEITVKSNIFELGKRIFEIVTGHLVCDFRRPFVPPCVPKELERLIDWSWSHLPSKRPTIMELRSTFESKFPVSKLQRLEFCRMGEMPFFRSKITGFEYPLSCPHSRKLLRNPMLMVETGYTYEEEDIRNHVERHQTDPLTRRRLFSDVMVKNFIVLHNSPYLKAGGAQAESGRRHSTMPTKASRRREARMTKSRRGSAAVATVEN